MQDKCRSLFVLMILVISTGCSMSVPIERVYGVYVASYSFGTEMITLNRDGTFVQSIAIKQEQPVTIHGTWEFQSKESRITMYGARVVDDGFGHLAKDWQTAPIGLVSLSAEIHWFRIVIGSGLPNPYMKQ